MCLLRPHCPNADLNADGCVKWLEREFFFKLLAENSQNLKGILPTEMICVEVLGPGRNGHFKLPAMDAMSNKVNLGSAQTVERQRRNRRCQVFSDRKITKIEAWIWGH
jgi:hypothetical protein